ncbi:MAG: type II toxin-antitoxin system Phd/YefM family antitoxin [Acidobacteriota bacterium]|nr:type II toxin-antitoxin system Phd/YefM family antitoxin [Acidobacteriota bacterium]MDE2965563.1 type II toxin-antitoxin system Phd/YefM family antitoxin [Acidobacteriota bacterium]
MDIYSYSEARRKLSSVLDKAESTGKVLIRRRDGRTYSLVPERLPVSPLDVPCVSANIDSQEVVELIRHERGRRRGVQRNS